MGKLDLSRVMRRAGTSYPPPLDQVVAGRSWLPLGDAGGLTQFGVNLVALEPGANSSMRHWHLNEDEFVMVTQGALILVMDDGETEMLPGDCAAFPAGVADGHCLINRTESVASFLVVGSRAPSEVATYPDMNIKVESEAGRSRFLNADGTDFIPSETGEN
ncbi:cupin domain-containing protein [Albibacillus kandeliae]|uniref:cupin domain-containing protein n=1 Tax=Albibacillus kandeliae TaxID=2174228 RepID=UPI000D6935A3|nr:cupin domain-containing protein [Albibacillus kandeliae]